MLRRISEIRKILRIEPEWCLHYLVGQKVSELKHLQDVRPGRLRGRFLKTLWFIVRPWLKENISWSQSSPLEKAKYYVYAGTGNQMKALIGFVEALHEKGERCQFLSTDQLISEHAVEKYCVPYGRTVSDVFVSQVVAVLRFLTLNRGLSYLPTKIKAGHYTSFLSVYGDLAVFLRTLSEVRPEYVVVSNDHSPGPRCLVAAARYLGIKTVYMQHASVSSLFPALRFTYAFLDGEKSLRTYEACEVNWPGGVSGYPKPQVFLSGQKKQLIYSDAVSDAVIGVAVNTLDPVDGIFSLVHVLRRADFPILLRWHPGQSVTDIARIYAEFEGDPLVQLSDPLREHVAGFLDRIHTMIAGNSSIHLEAALMGRRTIYFEIVPPATPDYYGYVKEKISVHARSVEELLSMLCNDESHNEEERGESIRHYSETYGTLWNGMEGELVAETLQLIGAGQDIESMYERTLNSGAFGPVHGLKRPVQSEVRKSMGHAVQG